MPITEKMSAENLTSQPVNPCLREIAVEVPAETVAREMESLLAKYTKLARLPGFRKGKAPATIIRQRFAEELRSDVIEQLVPRFFREHARLFPESTKTKWIWTLAIGAIVLILIPEICLVVCPY